MDTNAHGANLRLQKGCTNLKSKPLILVVEDQEINMEIIVNVLKETGYDYLTARDGMSGIEKLRSSPDAVLLDLVLPDMNGMELLPIIKSSGEIPVIIVSGINDTKHRIELLNTGADDYVTKPYDPKELTARLRSALRRYSKTAFDDDSSDCFMLGKLTISYLTRHASVGGNEIHLTENEYKILEYISRRYRKTVTYKELTDHIWDGQIVNPQKLLRVNMSNIRRKLSKFSGNESYIQTEPGTGYIMELIVIENVKTG